MNDGRMSNDRIVAGDPDNSVSRSLFRWRNFSLFISGAALGLSLAGCSAVDTANNKLDPTYGVAVSPRVVANGQPVPKGGGTYKVGKPYQVAGKTYIPAENADYVEEGTASWYGRDFHGRKTANGEVFDMESISVAHRTLPMPCYVRVTNLSNKRSIIARVNNRGPYARGRLLDVSYKTAELLGFARHGVTRVRVEYVGQAPLEGSDDRVLAMSLRNDGDPAQVPSNSAVMVASASSFIPKLPELFPIRMGEAPLPESRPYDLGQPGEEEDANTQVAVAEEPAPEPPRSPAAKSSPNVRSASRAVSSSGTKPAAAARSDAGAKSASAAKSAAKPAATKPDTRVAATSKTTASPVAGTPASSRKVNVAAAGWSTGPAPVSGQGFAGVTGRN